MGQERAARVSQDRAAPDAVEERRAQLTFEEMHAAADRRLGEVKRGGGTGESAAPHDRHEGLDVVEFHEPSA